MQEARHLRCAVLFYKWKARYGSVSASALQRLNELEAKNTKLKKMYGDLALENEAIKGVLDRKP